MVKPSSSSSSCGKGNGKKKGPWTEEEDNKLRNYVERYGHWNWRLLPKFAGLERCGKSCRLRWVNYLKPGLRKENFSKQEKDLIIKLHKQHGNKWTTIAARFPGRTDNDIKNFWHAHIMKSSKKRKSSQKSAKLLSKKDHNKKTDHDNDNEQSNSTNKEVLSMENQPPTSASKDGIVYDHGICTSTSDSFLVHTCYTDDYCLSPLPEVNLCSELSLSFGSTSFSTTLEWMIADDCDQSLLNSSSESAGLLMQEDFWNEPFMTDAIFQGGIGHLPAQVEGGFHDPSSLYCDPEIN